MQIQSNTKAEGEEKNFVLTWQALPYEYLGSKGNQNSHSQSTSRQVSGCDLLLNSMDSDVTMVPAGEGSSLPGPSSSSKKPKRFEIKKWNAVSLWAWGEYTKP